MSSLIYFFIVIVTTVDIPKKVTGSITVQDIDVDRLLDLVNQNRINPQDSDSYDSDDSDESDTSDELARNGRIEADSLMDIISLAVNGNNIKQASSDRKHRKPNHADRVQKYENRNNKHDSNSERTSNVAQILEQLINSGLRDVEPKWQSNSKSSKKRVAPNRLLGDSKLRNPDELDEYSKVYILLNPEALQKSKSSKSSINKMISKLLSLTSPSKRDQPAKPKERRYKGFAVKAGIERRRGRDSREMYAPKDSEREDKPRSMRQGGGGGGAGHTAIPYIRHRGENIYEKDN